MSDTVYAVATAAGRAAVAVVRLSGPHSGGVLQQLSGPLPTPRRAVVRALRAVDGALLDEAMVIWMPAPASYTGEDTVELHLHGGRAVVEGVLGALAAAGLRPADPGEFTRRAFEHGRLDLTRAEAVADLVDAETEAQRTQALAQLGGALDRRYARWRDALLEALARLETAVDFPDEDLPTTVLDDARARLSPLLTELRDALDDRRGRAVRDGFRIALLGPPNAGKSSLLNALAERDAAIVTPIAGTTRDIVEVSLNLAGRRVILADTAGLTETSDAVEREGVRRARQLAEEADLRVWLTAPDIAGEPPQPRPGDLLVASKSDLRGGGEGQLAVSTVSGEGLERLRAELTGCVVERLSGADFPPVTRQRHASALRNAIARLETALVASDPELAAEDVRLAARALSTVTGQIGAEDVLSRVFSSFCIGK